MTNPILLIRNEKIILWSYFAFLWTLIWIRAANLPPFPDEVFSWFLYGESGFYVPPEAQIDANNHVVNSFLTHNFTNWFGTSMLTLRLPNVLAFVLYFISCIGISRQQTTRGGFWISAISLTGIFYLLEFFSVSRGYGLSFAFLMLAIWLLLLLQAEFSWRQVFLLIAVTILALGSNLSLFFTFAVIGGWTIILLVRFSLKEGARTWVPAILLTAAFGGVLLFFYNYILFLESREMLYYGLTDDFPFATIKTLLIELTDLSGPWMYYLLLLLFALMLVFALLRIVKVRCWKLLEDNRVVFIVLLLANFAGIAYSVWKMDAPAPSDRTAAHIIPLFIGSGLFLFPHFSRQKRSSYVQAVFLLIPLASLTMMNVSYNHFWKEDQLDNRTFELIEKRMKTVPQPVTISGSRYFDRTYAFQNLVRGKKLPDYEFDSWPNDQSDFLLLRTYDYSPAKLTAYHQLYRDPHSGSYLMERNVHLQRQKIKQLYNRYEADSLEFLNLASFFVDSSMGNSFVAAFYCRFQFETSGECFIVSAALFDKDNNKLALKEQFHLNQLKSDWNNLESMHFTIPFFHLPKETAEIRVYIYNDKKVKHGKFRSVATIYQLIENDQIEN